MKHARFFLIVVPLATLLCGCSEMTPEDREFFGRGWIHPGELDKERPTKMPSHPETTGSLGPAAASSDLSTDTGGWTPPER